MVGVPPPDGPRPEPAHRRERRRSAAWSRSDRSPSRRRASRSGATRFPDQEYDLGRPGTLYDPRRKAAAPDEKYSTWACRRARRHRRGRPHPGYQARPGRAASRGRRPARHHRHAAAPRAPARARHVGRRPRHRCRRTGPGRARPPDGATAPRRPGPWPRRCARPARRTSRPRAGWRLSLDRTVLPIQGPPGSGKTYSGARMIVDPAGGGQAGRHHRDQPQGHRQPHRPRSSTAADEEGIDRPADPARPADQVHADRARHHVEERRGRCRATSCRMDGRTSPPARRWLWVSPKMVGRGRRAVRRRGRPDLAGQRRRGRAAPPRASCCSATRSSSISRLQGSHPPGADGSALAHVLGDARHDPAGPRPVPRDHLAAASGPVPRSRPRSSTTTGSSPSRTSASSASMPAAGDARRRRAAHRRGPDRGRRQRVARRGRTRSHRWRDALVEGGATWIDANGVRRRLDAGTTS